MMATVRVAHHDDLPALLDVRYRDQPLIHQDRIDGSDGEAMQYFVAEMDSQVVGFGLLLLQRPATWSDPLESFPILIDLFVTETARGRGVGSSLIRALEDMARQQGFPALYLSVEAETNPRAMQLYLRSGYQPLQTTPYHNVWRFTDSAGTLHEGEEYVIDMRKSLS